ncbi:hypothetical protein F2Q70_00022578 [Brassica cretica]|uniref:Uncharacterized protein n=1 Tax=Brassica cretica TaxID=69181 RepID=A0A8S9GSS1_BRACR|nr:hypothetical protein F2Q70_00022578 [Brassica cretica]
MVSDPSEGTVFRLPKRDYYRYPLGFRILPLGSCARLYHSPRLVKQSSAPCTCAYDFWGPRYALGYTGVLGSIDNILSEVELGFEGFVEPDPALYAPLTRGLCPVVKPRPLVGRSPSQLAHHGSWSCAIGWVGHGPTARRFLG